MSKTTKTTNNATKTTNATTTNVATKTNATKTNAVVNFESLYNDLNVCNSKFELVATMLKHGYYTSTTPTTTPNKNDLYIQFSDKSRLLIGKKSLKLYTNDKFISDNKPLQQFTFDMVNDGSYRNKRVTIANTLENFTKIFSFFSQYAVVPTTTTATATEK